MKKQKLTNHYSAMIESHFIRDAVEAIDEHGGAKEVLAVLNKLTASKKGRALSNSESFSADVLTVMCDMLKELV